MWGLGAVFMIHLVHPSIIKFTSVFNNRFGNYLLVILLLYFIADFIITTLAILKINKRLRLLEAMSKRIHLYSEGIGEAVYKGVSKTIKTADKIHNKLQGSRSILKVRVGKDLNIITLREKYNKLLKEKNFVHRRLEKAYPNIKKKLNKYK